MCAALYDCTVDFLAPLLASGSTLVALVVGAVSAYRARLQFKGAAADRSLQILQQLMDRGLVQDDDLAEPRRRRLEAESATVNGSAHVDLGALTTMVAEAQVLPGTPAMVQVPPADFAQLVANLKGIAETLVL